MAEENSMMLDLEMLLAGLYTVYSKVAKVNLTKNTICLMTPDNLEDRKIEDCAQIIWEAAQTIPKGYQRDGYLEHFEPRKQIEAYERGEKSISYVHQQIDKDGQYHWMESRGIFIDSDNDDILQLAVSRYIDDEMKKQEELKKAVEAADSANKAKTNFLFNMSHDIRTPMNAIMGYSRLLKNGLTDPTMLHYQEKVEQSSEFLLSLINNVLDVARIESGHMELDVEYSVAGNIIAGIISVFEEQARLKNIELVYSTDMHHKHIMCDKLKLQEIFTNLISNAIKYTTDGGRVTVTTVEVASEKEGYATYQTTVEDTGIGMSQQFLPQLFQNFSREKNTTTSGVGGTGLGMPIVKKYVDLMGGTIDVESELGKGTKITVTLSYPIGDDDYISADAKAQEDTDALIAKFEGKHILLAEDNELNAEIAITILESIGFIVDHVEDGIVVVDKIEQSEAGTYDMILMDIQMPFMDGYKATQVIRRLSNKEKANIPIIALTANAFEEDKRSALQAGMNGHLAKPIEIPKLMEMLAELLITE